MYIKQSPYFKRFLKRASYYLFHRLENNGNADFESNGEEAFMEYFLKTSTNDLQIFDVGAHQGHWTALIQSEAQRKGKNIQVHLFEPLEMNVDVLHKKFNTQKKFLVNAFGISEEEEIKEIFYHPLHSTLTSLYHRILAGVDQYQKANIQLKRLDHYIEAQNIQKIDFLKLDVEGHELSALKSLGKYLNPDFIQAIQFEYGDTSRAARIYLKDFYELLEPKSFKIFKIMPNHIEERPYTLQMENFNYANYLALSQGLMHRLNSNKSL